MAQVDGQTVRVGDIVSFKSDYEQCGVILEIRGNNLLLGCQNLEGFGGDYLRGAETTVQRAVDCWLD